MEKLPCFHTKKSLSIPEISRFRHTSSGPCQADFFIRLMLFGLLFVPVVVSAQPRVDSVLHIIEHSESAEEKADAYLSLSGRYIQTDPAKAFEYAALARQEAEDGGLQAKLGKVYLHLATSSIYQGDHEKAIEYFESSLDLSRSLGDTLGMANVIGNIGMVHTISGSYSEALKYQFEALNMFELIKDTAGILNTHLAIGSIYMENGKYDEALKHDSVSLLGYEALQNPNGIALVSGNMANVFADLNQHEKAKDFRLRAIALYRELNAPLDLSRELSNLATIYEMKGNLVRAIEASEESISLNEMTGFVQGISQSRGNLGAFYLTSYEALVSGDTTVAIPDLSEKILLDRAISNFQTSVDLIEKSGDNRMQAWLSEKLSTALAAKGDYKGAYHYFKKSKTLTDSIHSLASKKQIEALTTEREVALAEKQIELDRLAVQKKRNERVYFIVGLALLGLLASVIYRSYQNQLKSNVKLESKNTDLNTALVQLKETQDQLVESERQKEKALIRTRISQDIHDDISSGLTKISWLSERLTNKRKKGDEEGLEKIVDKINNTSRMTVSKLGEIIWSTNPTRDNVRSFLSYLKNHATTFFEGSAIGVEFNFQTREDDLSLDPEVRRNLFLVVKEALNNAFKYSQADQVKIDFNLDEAGYHLLVSDDGVGMEEGVVKGGGDGLSNMENRMHAIQGNLDIHSGVNEGTQIRLTGPLLIS